MISLARAADDVTVIRLSKSKDEAYGDLTTALERIDAYAAGLVPFSPRDAREATLKAITKIARAAEDIEHRRKVVVCIGMRLVCDVTEPIDGPTSFTWPFWIDAVRSAARANVSVYAIDPTGLNSRSGPRPYGLIAATGGELFADSNAIDAAVRSIWWEASRFYLLGYWPSASKRDLHSVDVKALRKGLTARARRLR